MAEIGPIPLGEYILEIIHPLSNTTVYLGKVEVKEKPRIYYFDTSLIDLRVNVVDELGNPIPKVTVQLTAPNFSALLYTNEKGIVTFRNIPTTEYKVSAKLGNIVVTKVIKTSRRTTIKMPGIYLCGIFFDRTSVLITVFSIGLGIFLLIRIKRRNEVTI